MRNPNSVIFKNKWNWFERDILETSAIYRWIKYTPIILYYRIKLFFAPKSHKLVWGNGSWG